MRCTVFRYKAFIRPFVRQYTTTECKKNYDVIIAGGGVMGLSSAYFLARRINPSSICVIERDLKVTRY